MSQSSSVNDYECLLRPTGLGDWICVFPELLGCVVRAPDKETAFTKGHEAAQKWLDQAAELGVFASVVRTAHLQPSGMVRIRTAKSIHARLTALADSKGVPLIALVAAMVEVHLQQIMLNQKSSEHDKENAVMVYLKTHGSKKAATPRKDRNPSGSWLQRFSPSTHRLCQSIAIHEGVSANLFLNCILVEQLALAESAEVNGQQEQ